MIDLSSLLLVALLPILTPSSAFPVEQDPPPRRQTVRPDCALPLPPKVELRKGTMLSPHELIPWQPVAPIVTRIGLPQGLEFGPALRPHPYHVDLLPGAHEGVSGAKIVLVDENGKRHEFRAKHIEIRLDGSVPAKAPRAAQVSGGVPVPKGMRLSAVRVEV